MEKLVEGVIKCREEGVRIEKEECVVRCRSVEKRGSERRKCDRE